MKRFPDQLQKQNIFTFNIQEILNPLEASDKLSRKIHTLRFVPIQILLSENVKILES